MKKISFLITILAFVAVLAMTASANAAVVDKTASVSASGIVVGVTSLSVTSGSTLTYATTTADAYPTAPTSKKVVLNYTSNYNPWKIAIYTNNTQVPNYGVDTTGDGVADGRYAKGGLATSNGLNTVPCKWVAKIGTSTTVPSVPAYGTYNFVKDWRDEDDPLTLDDPGTPEVENDESWVAAFAQGYANIAYGDSTGAGVCVDPANPPTYRGDEIPSTTHSISVYIAGLFGTSGMNPAIPAAAASYSTTFYFDLYHE